MWRINFKQNFSWIYLNFRNEYKSFNSQIISIKIFMICRQVNFKET